MNPLALTLEEVARLLSAAGGRKVTPEQAQADIDTGAPRSNCHENTPHELEVEIASGIAIDQYMNGIIVYVIAQGKC